ncbi:MAG: hypothetical protein AAF628_03090 [Planctomycetota bacterium]
MTFSAVVTIPGPGSGGVAGRYVAVGASRGAVRATGWMFLHQWVSGDPNGCGAFALSNAKRVTLQ